MKIRIVIISMVLFLLFCFLLGAVWSDEKPVFKGKTWQECAVNVGIFLGADFKEIDTRHYHHYCSVETRQSLIFSKRLMAVLIMDGNFDVWMAKSSEEGVWYLFVVDKKDKSSGLTSIFLEMMKELRETVQRCREEEQKKWTQVY